MEQSSAVAFMDAIINYCSYLTSNFPSLKKIWTVFSAAKNVAVQSDEVQPPLSTLLCRQDWQTK